MDTNDLCNEKLIERFFNENPIEIEDNGFSRRVMRRLPDRPARLNRLWTGFCAAMFLVAVFKMNAITWLKGCVSGAMAAIPSGSPVFDNPLFLLFALAMAVFLCSAAAAFKVLR